MRIPDWVETAVYKWLGITRPSVYYSDSLYVLSKRIDEIVRRMGVKYHDLDKDYLLVNVTVTFRRGDLYARAVVVPNHSDEEIEETLQLALEQIAHKDRQTAVVATLLAVKGWGKSVVVDPQTGHIVDGHARAALAMKRGSMILVEYIDVSEEQSE